MCYGHRTQRERNNRHVEIITVEKKKYRQKNEAREIRRKRIEKKKEGKKESEEKYT